MSRNLCVDALYQTLPELKRPIRQMKLLAAFSGGADSAALLAALCEVREETGCALQAVHIQHGLRGESSLADERFAREFCKRLEVPLTVRVAALSGDMHSPGIEQKARAERYRLFREEFDRIGAAALLLAHHRDDQSETVLMHLCRGAAADGLHGMRVLSDYEGMPVLRPFLRLPKAALLEELARRGLAHCEDESNAEACTDRNRMRLEILPALKRLYPGADAAVARAAEALAKDSDCLNELADELFRSCLFQPFTGVAGCWREQLAHAAEALRTRVLRALFDECAAQLGDAAGQRCLTYEETRTLDEAVQKGKACNLPLGLRAVCDERWVLIGRQDGLPLVPQDMPVLLEGLYGSDTFICNGLRITAQPAAEVPRDAYHAVLTPEMQSRALVWRTQLPGDGIHPFGAPGGKPLRRYFTDRKMPHPLRAAIPLLCDGAEVLWVPGLCVSEKLRQQLPPQGSLLLTADRWRERRPVR